MLAELQRERSRLEEAGVQIVLVHMGEKSQAVELFSRYGLDDVPQIADARRNLYRAFGLAEGGLNQIAGPRIWWKGLQTTLKGFLPGKPQGNVRQLAGAFLVQEGKIVRTHRARHSADHPDFLSFLPGDDPE